MSPATHKDTHKLQAFHAISSHLLARPRRTMNRQKSFILKSFGTTSHLLTLTRKTASLGFEPRQRDSESLVLPLHHEATREKIKDRQPLLQVERSRVARDLSGCGFRAEQDLSAFPSSFDLQSLSALCHQRARVFYHFVNHFVIMIRIVMEKHELAHV